MRIREVIFVAAVIFGLWFTFVPPEVAKERGVAVFGTKDTPENATSSQATPEMAAPAVAE